MPVAFLGKVSPLLLCLQYSIFLLSIKDLKKKYAIEFVRVLLVSTHVNS